MKPKAGSGGTRKAMHLKAQGTSKERRKQMSGRSNGASGTRKILYLSKRCLESHSRLESHWRNVQGASKISKEPRSARAKISKPKVKERQKQQAQALSEGRISKPSPASPSMWEDPCCRLNQSMLGNAGCCRQHPQPADVVGDLGPSMLALVGDLGSHSISGGSKCLGSKCLGSTEPAD